MAYRPRSALARLVFDGQPLRPLQPRTRELYAECVDRFVSFAGTDGRNWTHETTTDWLRSLLARGLRPQTVGIYRKAIRYASLQLARAQSRPDLNFAALVEPTGADAPKHKEVLAIEEVTRLLWSCERGELEDIRDRAIIILAMRTGLRRGGMRELLIEGIRPPKITTRNKGGKNLTFAADAEVFEALEAWTIVLRSFRITSGPVFRRVVGKRPVEPMTDFQIWDVFRRRSRAAGIRHVNPHLLRHSLVTWLREAGVTPDVISQLTGQTERTIENTYTHTRLKAPVASVLPPLLRK